MAYISKIVHGFVCGNAELPFSKFSKMKKCEFSLPFFEVPQDIEVEKMKVHKRYRKARLFSKKRDRCDN